MSIVNEVKGMWQLAVKTKPEGKGNKGKQEGEEEEKET